jgi:hypothetical protein
VVSVWFRYCGAVECLGLFFDVLFQVLGYCFALGSVSKVLTRGYAAPYHLYMLASILFPRGVFLVVLRLVFAGMLVGFLWFFLGVVAEF